MSKKDAYVQKAQAKIDEQSAKIDEFKAKVKGKVADKKIEAHEQLEKIESKLNAAKAQLAEIVGSAESAWEDMTKRFEVLTDELSASVKKFFKK
jgi:cob(I)alamin adenosyltransferase